MTIGERIRQRREELGISQTALADAVNSTKQNIYKYETGAITNIPSDKIEQIAAVLHVTPSYLMGWEESRTEINERIKQRRKELGLSAEQVADMIGVSPATVYRYESSDIKNMPAERLKPIGQHRVRVNHTHHFRAVQMAVQVEKAAAFRNRRETVKNCIRYGFSHGNIV